MKIRIIRNTINGPTRGDVLDLPDDSAKALIQAGTAEPAPDAIIPEAVAPEVEPEAPEEPAKSEKHPKKKH